MTLPPLPSTPWCWLVNEGNPYEPEWTSYQSGYTGEDMRAFWQSGYEAGAAAERERCLQVAAEHARRNFPWGSENSDRYHAQADWAERIVAAIRGMKP